MEYRVLHPDEYIKLPDDFPAPDGLTPDNTAIVAAIDEEGEVVAAWVLCMVWHSEPLWIREDHRKSATLIRRMAETVKKVCKVLRIKTHYAVIPTPVLKKIAEWYGAKPMPGELYRYDEEEV